MKIFVRYCASCQKKILKKDNKRGTKCFHSNKHKHITQEKTGLTARPISSFIQEAKRFRESLYSVGKDVVLRSYITGLSSEAVPQKIIFQ